MAIHSPSVADGDTGDENFEPSNGGSNGVGGAMSEGEADIAPPNVKGSLTTTTVEQAVLCLNGLIHFGPEYHKGQSSEELRGIADRAGQSWRSEANRDCGPHVCAHRERIVTAWQVDDE